MLFRGSICAIAVAALLSSPVQAFDDAKYPDFSGQWRAVRPPGVDGQSAFDPTKPWGRGQQAPLTPEYQALLEASLADQAGGGQGNWPSGIRCMPAGMPASMNVYGEMEIVVLPETTYVLLNHNTEIKRRIYTDGRDWPAEIEPSYQGYSIGRWSEPDGEGRYSVLEVDTHGPFKGPRAYDASGLPLAFDNQSTFKERFHLDKNDPNILHNEITVFDHALTRPWSVDKTFRRNPNPRPKWNETSCVEGNNQVVLGKENYFLSADGLLMPTKKDQAPPDLKYFKQTQTSK
jgi:hypothetical protein